MTTAPDHALTPANTQDDLHDEFLGALEALGGSAGNGRLREMLEWDEASYEAVKGDLLSRRLIVPGRGRGGSVALADGSAEEAPGHGQEFSSAPSNRAPNGARAAAPSSFEQAFRAIDDCLRKEAGCGTELDYRADLLAAVPQVPRRTRRRQSHRGRPGGPQHHADPR
ncbi:hypothetical protein [Cyanobium sp. ATX 6F1]|uniref:hypothetical protein n=1 Tax=unclassified Cyanobium TaxID=2627006 RepID=UPI0020CE8C5F|nr:hypothetical protein [Cyanobium sp. ATX 6F1]